jgi:spore coat protein U-like protein
MTPGARAAALVLAGGLACAPARAAINCSISVSTPVAFGQYDVFNPVAVDTVGALRMVCNRVSAPSARVSYSIALSPGFGGAYVPSRQLSGGATRMNYNLYIDAARSQIWGDGSGGSAVVTGTTARLTPARPSVTVNHSVYGRIPALQDLAVGGYFDFITVTVTY